MLAQNPRYHQQKQHIETQVEMQKIRLLATYVSKKRLMVLQSYQMFREVLRRCDSDISQANAIENFPNLLLMADAVSQQPKTEFNAKAMSLKTITNKKIDINNIDEIWNEIMTENGASESYNDEVSTEAPNDIMTDNISENYCPNCKCETELIEDQKANLLICSECGMVVQEIMDHGPEWRQCNNDDSRGEGVNRCACPVNFFFPTASQGTIITGSSNSRLKRKQKWNYMVYKERSLNNVFEYISKICAKNNIKKICVDTAKTFYKQLNDCKHKVGNNIGKQVIIRGENRKSIIAACVHRACRVNHDPRTIKEIAKFFGLADKKITKGIKQYEKIMKNSDEYSVFNDENNDTTPDYIRRHCPKLGIGPEYMELAVKIAANCCRMKLASDHNPQSIAAGAILIMINYCELPINKRRISYVFGTTDVTIIKIYNKIRHYARALVDDEITDFVIERFKING